MCQHPQGGFEKMPAAADAKSAESAKGRKEF